jgi:hypothetical protein
MCDRTHPDCNGSRHSEQAPVALSKPFSSHLWLSSISGGTLFRVVAALGYPRFTEVASGQQVEALT